ncbi:PaaI family thioesterase [Aminobacterium colombiense]|uniref:Acyl-coenzyme A thioesterase THEM4 n=1 Tax=Aminobacterium colombiense (strain DSM 12261 / ALA-1) TaxID=572547 RepID=D5ECB7_AMICL|nr:PaaI family thioesterase [Aminobacterium colombiense]ADE56199.1 thioesterase superfamily protein [Aminobacterium colombiense DSM 12261]
MIEKLEGSQGCFVCDTTNTNPRSLKLAIYWDSERRKTIIRLTPDSSHCGYEGIVHGGIIASIFDDAMAWAVKKETGIWAVTATFEIRYRQPVKIGEEYTFYGKIDSVLGKRIRTSALLKNSTGQEAASASALFISMEPNS